MIAPNRLVATDFPVVRSEVSRLPSPSEPVRNRGRGLVAALILVTVVAAVPRVHRLGDWSFMDDEVGTMESVDVWLSPPADKSSLSPNHRIPRIIPASMAYLHVGRRLFGDSEWGMRVLPALTGVLLAVAAFLVVRSLYGAWAGLATGLVIAVTPEHVYFSQLGRFYALATFTVAGTALCGAVAVRRRSVGWCVAACGLGFLTLLSHTVEAIVLGGLGLGLLAAHVVRQSLLSKHGRQQFVVLATTAVSCVAFHLLVVWGIAAAKAGYSGGWVGYDVTSSVAAAVLNVGWWMLPLALLGLIRLHLDRPAEAAYWMAHTLCWGAVAVVLPYVLAYHPEYAFAQSISVFVLAGIGVGWIAERLAATSRPAAVAWMLVVLAMPSPGLASYARDGNRHDYRAATRFLDEHSADGDLLVTPTPRIVEHYATRPLEATPLPVDDAVATLERILDESGDRRLWIVWPSGRAGIDEPLRRWFAEHCVEETRIGSRRFDYYEFTLHVYRTRGQMSDVRDQ